MAKKKKEEEEVEVEETTDVEGVDQGFDPGAIATIEAQQARLLLVENAYRGLEVEHAELQTLQEQTMGAFDKLDEETADLHQIQRRLEEEVEEWRKRCEREQNAPTEHPRREGPPRRADSRSLVRPVS